MKWNKINSEHWESEDGVWKLKKEAPGFKGWTALVCHPDGWEEDNGLYATSLDRIKKDAEQYHDQALSDIAAHKEDVKAEEETRRRIEREEREAEEARTTGPGTYRVCLRSTVTLEYITEVYVKADSREQVDDNMDKIIDETLERTDVEWECQDDPEDRWAPDTEADEPEFMEGYADRRFVDPLDFDLTGPTQAAPEPAEATQ